MTLIKSISGIRGTIGGGAGEGLNPLDIVKFTSAYATLIRKTCTVKSNKIVVGRDARISGEMVKNVVVGTLMGMGWDVVDIDLASTPTTELAVTMEGASGGIILTASHNPKQWNALKLLNEKGEFLNKEEGNEVLRIAEAEEFDFAEVDKLGSYRKDLTYNQKHIDSVLALDLVDVEAIRKADFRVAIDCVNYAVAPSSCLRKSLSCSLPQGGWHPSKHRNERKSPCLQSPSRVFGTPARHRQ